MVVYFIIFSHIFDFQNKNGSAILNTETLCAGQLADAAAKANLHHIIKFGRNEQADYQLKKFSVNAGGQEIEAKLQTSINN